MKHKASVLFMLIIVCAISTLAQTTSGGTGISVVPPNGADPSIIINGPPGTGAVALAPDSEDSVNSMTSSQTLSQMHIRLTRGIPEALGGNPNAQHFIIAPYNYGVMIEYPSVLELAVPQLFDTR